MKKIFQTIDSPKAVAVFGAAFATGFSIYAAPDFWQFGSHYFAGAATAFALMFCLDEED